MSPEKQQLIRELMADWTESMINNNQVPVGLVQIICTEDPPPYLVEYQFAEWTTSGLVTPSMTTQLQYVRIIEKDLALMVKAEKKLQNEG